MEVKTEIQTPYQTTPTPDMLEAFENNIIANALEIIENRLMKPVSDPMNHAEAVEKYFRIKLRSEIIEQFWVLGLDAQNRLVKIIEISNGTTNGAIVYPREIIRALINTTAKGVVLIHNHPSGRVEPSKEDIQITEQIFDALNPIEIQLLDHIIIGKTSYSFANAGKLPTKK